MKRVKQFFITSAFFTSMFFTAHSQQSLDSVVVSFGTDIRIDMAVYEYNGLSQKIETDLKNMQSILKSTNVADKNSDYTIFYETGKQLYIKPNQSTETIIWKNEKTEHMNFSKTCLIYGNTVYEGFSTNNYFMRIQFNELDSLLSSDFPAKMEQIADSLLKLENRRSYTYFFDVNNSNIKQSPAKNIFTNHSASYIAFGASAGVNLIKNTLLPDLSIYAGVVLGYKKIPTHYFRISYNQLSYFENFSTNNSNGFINLAYFRNLSNIVGKNQFSGLEFGYLIMRNGDIFEKNTFKFGVLWQLNNYISISPQLYFSKNQSYPALRFSVGF